MLSIESPRQQLRLETIDDLDMSYVTGIEQRLRMQVPGVRAVEAI